MGAHISKFKNLIAVKCSNEVATTLIHLAGKPKYEAKLGCHTLAFSSRTCYFLVKTLKDAGEIDSCSKEITDAATRYYYALQKKTCTDVQPIPGMKYPPWEHQHQGFHFGAPLEGVVLNMDMGCGKTYTTIAEVITNENNNFVITFCPKKVIPVWPKEVAKYIEDNNYVLCAPNKKSMSVADKKKELEKAIISAQYQGKKLWFVANYDAVWREPLSDMLLDINWDILILDEIHRIKSHDGRASKFCWKLARKTKKRIGLTGTLMPHSPLDVYAIFRSIDESIFGTSYTAFRNHFVVYGGYNMKEVKGYINTQEMHDKIASITYRVTKDVLDLPPFQHITLECDLSPAARKIYKQLFDDLYAEVEAGEITVANALVKLLRLQQLTGGHLPLDDGTTKRVDTSKQEVVEDLLEDLDKKEPVVVFYRFHGDARAIKEACAKVGRTCGELSGQHDDLDDWQNGKFNVLAVQIQAGGVGIDLTRACYVIYYSVGFNMGDYLQSLARAHRPGQTRHTFFYHILVKDTVDERVYKALDTRAQIVEFVMEGIKKNPFGNKMCSPGGGFVNATQPEEIWQ